MSATTRTAARAHPITFCGQLVEDGSSYCPFHKKLTHTTPTTRRDLYNDFTNYRGVR